MDQQERIHLFLDWAIADGPPSSTFTITREDAMQMLVVVANQAMHELAATTVEFIGRGHNLDGI